MSGMVGVIANDNARYSLFSVALTELAGNVPVNTRLKWSLTSDRILGRNRLAHRAVEGGYEWLMFIDDDHVFPTNIVNRLLAHDVGIVGSLYLQRQKPFAPIAYMAKTEDEVYVPLDLTLCKPDELVEVVACGTGGMLIRAEVFHKMQEAWPKDGDMYPYFEHGRASEDLIFCDKARQLGFPVYVDVGCRMGHMMPTSVWPGYETDTEQWAVTWALADEFSLSVPIQTPNRVEQDVAVSADTLPG